MLKNAAHSPPSPGELCYSPSPELAETSSLPGGRTRPQFVLGSSKSSTYPTG